MDGLVKYITLHCFERCYISIWLSYITFVKLSNWLCIDFWLSFVERASLLRRVSCRFSNVASTLAPSHSAIHQNSTSSTSTNAAICRKMRRQSFQGKWTSSFAGTNRIKSTVARLFWLVGCQVWIAGGVKSWFQPIEPHFKLSSQYSDWLFRVDAGSESGEVIP